MQMMIGGALNLEILDSKAALIGRIGLLLKIPMEY